MGMFSKMSVIAFTVGLVATLCVTDVNAVVYETCKFSDAACTQEVEGSCLGGLAAPGTDADDYASTQAGYGDYLGAAEYKNCKQLAKAQWEKYESMPEKGDDPYTEDAFIAMMNDVSCFPQKNEDGTFYGSRCGASFTGSSMAALFGLLCVSLALW